MSPPRVSHKSITHAEDIKQSREYHSLERDGEEWDTMEDEVSRTCFRLNLQPERPAQGDHGTD